jgi:signal transduction histidine kinase
MWSKTKRCKHRLSREILGLFATTALCAFFSFWALNQIANSIVLNYVDSEMLVISENELIDIQYGIFGISMVSGVILFIVLFLFLVGERLSYITEIVNGIDALGRREWGYQIPVQGENELTELVNRVNELSKEEQAFQEKEKQMQEEKISLIRSLSHDIRTPLTSMMSYSELMKQKENLTQDEIKNYMELVEQKSQQIKVLTERLLDGGNRQLVFIEQGRFLMEQLVDEWESELEEDFNCQVYLEACPAFQGEFDVEELRRIFDNLASNIRKYADETVPVLLEIKEQNGRVCICQ